MKKPTGYDIVTCKPNEPGGIRK